ncbi:MAG: aldehyde dehydrogenase family protein, partial [Pseudorhodobacter sp.]|nr:aldehyde dehydrogenase family protein [Rhizobacter sp.]
MSGFFDPTYIYNWAQNRAGFQFLNRVSNDGYNYDNGCFGTASIDFQKEMDGGTKWRLTLMPNRGAGSIADFDGNSIVHEASVSIPLGDLQTRFLAGQIPDWSGYEYIQATTTKLATRVLALITREPMGVIGAVVPWSYPMIMAAWKLGPALAAGNSVVLKPIEKSPLTALRLAELAIEADLPGGVLNVVQGFGHESGEGLALHMVLVHESIADEFVSIVASEAPKYAPGDPLSGTAQMGAIVDDVQVRAVMGFISSGSEDGARVAAGDKQVRADSGGYFVEPTVFDGVTNQMRIAREEIFGPVMSVIRFKTEEEAVAIANDSSYGL